MTSPASRPFGAFLLSAALVALAVQPAAAADEPKAPAGPGLMGTGFWRLAVSPFSAHFRYSAEHRYVWAVGAEWQRNDNWLGGASYFSNSFGQPSAYIYVGKRFPAMFGVPELFGQLSGGMLYGYRGKYEDKVPLNYKGFSPGALAGMGWQFNKTTSAVVHLLGDAGFMVQLSYDLR
jgi:hypothetical protein